MHHRGAEGAEKTQRRFNRMHAEHADTETLTHVSWPAQAGHPRLCRCRCMTSPSRRSGAFGVPPRRINEIVLGKRSVTADTDLRLARYFGLSDGFWLGLQADHDLLQRRSRIAA